MDAGRAARAPLARGGNRLFEETPADTFADMARIYRRCFLLLVLGTMGMVVTSRGDNVFAHRGFQVDDAAVRGLPNPEAFHPALQAQIDMVLAVGLPGDVLKAFRAIPIAVVPDGTFQSPMPGRYLGPTNTVQLSANFLRQSRRPVLLHELMHAYHHRLLPDGTRNAQVLAFYDRAKGLNCYLAESHMMTNVGEFFACSATAYLYGRTAQEPFTRAKVRENQPKWDRFLQELFGPAAGKYEAKP